ncbi:MAG TPA: RDD family protein [Mycobacteriales bacterium]|nr:RDD family protein [Mycobacteriales bacterium]
MTTPQDPFTPPSEGAALPSYPTTPTGGAEPYGAPPTSHQPAYGDPAAGGEWNGPPLASWGRRAGGALIDAVISAIAGAVAGLVNDDLGLAAQIAVFLYFGYLTGTTGQTPGRKLVGIKVVRESDGGMLGGGSGIWRGFLHILDALPAFLGYLWPLWDKKNQTFADKIIHSVVIKV